MSSGAFCFALTGAPCAGKTSAGLYIGQETMASVVGEAATYVYDRRKAEGYPNPWADFSWMVNKLQQVQILDMQKLQYSRPTTITFIDRTILDSETYALHYAGQSSDQLARGIKIMKESGLFNNTVFLFNLNPDPTKFETTLTRPQKYEEALVLQTKFEETYKAHGYKVCHVPWGSLEDRAKLVIGIALASLPVTLSKELPFEPIEEVYPLNFLPAFADGLNDEGRGIEEFLSPHQIWGNLCAVLDRPFVDGVEYAQLEEIKRKENYDTKEAAISSFNERQVNLSNITILHHYITNAHKIANKPTDENVTIIVHQFRSKDGIAQLNLLDNLLNTVFPQLKKEKGEKDATFTPELFRYHFPDQRVTAIFTYGVAPKVYQALGNSNHFKKSDIVLTFSVIAGMNPNWPAGTLLIPNEWIPLALDKLELNFNRKQLGRNHLVKSIVDVVENSNESLVEKINTEFSSLNPSKNNQFARNLKLTDFKAATLFQVDGFIFNPSSFAGKKFTVIRN